MNTTLTPGTAQAAERLHVDREVTKRLGRWTAAGEFDVRVRSGVLVLDLRSPEIPGDVEIRLDLHQATVKLLLAEEDRLDHWDVAWAGRGQVKDDQRTASTTGGQAGRRIHLSGAANNSEIRVHRGGIAILSAMFSRAFVQDLRQARRNGGYPTVDDPARPAR